MGRSWSEGFASTITAKADPHHFAFSVLLLVFSSVAPARTRRSKTLSAGEVSAIRALLERFRTGWLANNADAVRSAFSSDAILMPPHGLPPVIGMEAINQFWWPATTTKTTITKFVQTVDEVGGNGTLAYVRGTSKVAWTVEDANAQQKWRTGGNFMALLKRQADGKWLITHLIWDDPPNKLVR